MKDFGSADRPYNVAAFPRQSGGRYVYSYLAQTKANVYPLGADVHYLLLTDGGYHREAKDAQNDPRIRRSNELSGDDGGSYHTHVLSNVPEDTDVMLVLLREPHVQESVGAGNYVYTIATDGTITVADLPQEPVHYRCFRGSTPY